MPTRTPIRIVSSTLSCFVAALCLGACAMKDSKAARSAETTLLGLSEVDVESCLGAPNRKDKIDRTSILSYDGTSTNSGGLSLNLPVVGGINFSGGGFCHLTARVDGGRVTAIRYTGETDAPFAPDAYCAPLVRSCLEMARATPGRAADAPADVPK